MAEAGGGSTREDIDVSIGLWDDNEFANWSYYGGSDWKMEEVLRGKEGRRKGGGGRRKKKEDILSVIKGSYPLGGLSDSDIIRGYRFGVFVYFPPQIG